MLDGKFYRNKIEKSSSNNTIPKSRAGGRRTNFTFREKFIKIKFGNPDTLELLMPTRFEKKSQKFELI